MDSKHIMAENIKRHIDNLGLNVKEFAALMNFKYSTTLDWVNAKTYPRIDKIDKMAEYFGVSKSDLVERRKSSDSNELVKLYEQLLPSGQEVVLDTARQQFEFQQAHRIDEPAETYTALYPVETTEKVAAGFGYGYEGNKTETYYTDRNDLANYDIATVVTGSSMEPILHDGDVILIQRTYDVIPGSIYVIDYDEKSYVKYLKRSNDKITLHSENEEYPDMTFPVPPDDDNYWNIIGRVVDWFSPIENF